jgi:hypothetical protein
MNHLKRWLSSLNMSWRNVLLLAVGAGLYTGLINQVPALQNTSFTDIAVTYEVWVVFAILIAVRCRTALESAGKIFCFFLISQPLCFLAEIPMIGSAQAYYYFQLWLPKILLTFPGGFAAFYLQKDNLVGALLAAAAAAFEAVFLAGYGLGLLFNFPRHLLTVLFCLVTILCLIVLQTGRKSFRILIAAAALVSAVWYGLQMTETQAVLTEQLPAGYEDGTLSVQDGSYAVIDGETGYFYYYYKPFSARDNVLTFTDSAGSTITFHVIREGSSLRLEQQEK